MKWQRKKHHKFDMIVISVFGTYECTMQVMITAVIYIYIFPSFLISQMTHQNNCSISEKCSPELGILA